MKKILLATALSLCVTSAFAADPTAVLKVKGTLTNAACTPTLSNGGVIDYGYIRLGDLSATTVNQLDDKYIDLTITCTAATKVGFTASDDRSDSSANITVISPKGTTLGSEQTYLKYGVGKTADDVKIGNYTLYVKDGAVTVDGNEGISLGQNGDWTDGHWSAGSGIRSDSFVTITAGAKGTTEPLAFTTATFPLMTSLVIQATDTLAMTDDTQLDGQATLTLKYL